METAFLIVTNRCNRSCPFCFYRTGYLSHPRREMSRGEAREVPGRLAELGVGNLIITGGEPLLRSDLPALIQRAGELGLVRILLTNGDLLDEDSVRGLLKLGIEGITLSVNAIKEARSLEKVAARLQENPGLSVAVTTVFHKGNVSELKEIYRWARGKGWGMILQPAFLPRGPAEFDRLSPRAFTPAEWEIVDTVLREWKRSQSTGSYPAYVAGLYGRGWRPESCRMGEEALVVDSDGEVYPCFHRPDLGAGNIFRSRPGEIRARLAAAFKDLSSASCFGEHCVSLFYGQ